MARIWLLVLGFTLGCSAENWRFEGGTGGSGGAPGGSSEPTMTGGDDEGTGIGPACLDEIGERCSPYEDNPCPSGFKCSPLANQGDGARCIPARQETMAGDECSLKCQGTRDTCGHGQICLSDGSESSVCVDMCVGDQSCPHPMLSCVELEWEATLFGLCLIPCNPLNTETCPPDALCVPFENAFACIDDDTGDAGEPGDPCEGPAECDPGLACIPSANDPECEAEGEQGCCTHYCNLFEAGACPDGLGCLPVEGLPEHDSLGVCAVPG